MWAQPWAWLGLAGVAVPIAIHLLARHQAVRALFPSLRFIDVTELNFIKRHRLTDVPLLLVRLALVAAAVTAIAGPQWRVANAGGTGPLALAVVVDTSESAGGAGRAGSAGDAGRAGLSAARAAVRDAASSVIVETDSLPGGIKSASAWLAGQSGRRDMLIVSDFQSGSLDDAAVAAVPVGVGLRFSVLPMAPLASPDGLELRKDRSRMTWPAAASRAGLPVAVKAGSDQVRADAMLSAVASVVGARQPSDDGHRALIVFPAARERTAIAASAPPISQPWMFTVARPLLNDPETRPHVAVRADAGALVVLVDADPASVLAATVTSTVLQAMQQGVPWSELEPLAIPAETLRRWERAPSPAPAVNATEPQGRWLWVAVLVLLALETWMRRKPAMPLTREVTHARVA